MTIKKTLRLIFLLMVVFGGFYMSRGWPDKGPATILFETCSILTGLAGLMFLGLLGLFGKK